MAALNCVNTSLFIGDLPKFCTEVDLEQLFLPYGPILDVKIKRNNSTGKTLSYGFVTFATEIAAAEALKQVDGTMFFGRKLRLRWAMYNARTQNPTSTQHGNVINSIYVRFVTQRMDRYITEEDFHYVFDAFGNVLDVSIKESSVDNRLGRQSGYGFVHFSCDMKGIEAAFQAVSTVDNATIDNVTYNVELSKNLLKQFGDSRGNLDHQALAARFPGQSSALQPVVPQHVPSHRQMPPVAPQLQKHHPLLTGLIGSNQSQTFSNGSQFMTSAYRAPQQQQATWTSQPAAPMQYAREPSMFSGVSEHGSYYASMPSMTEHLQQQQPQYPFRTSNAPDMYAQPRQLERRSPVTASASAMSTNAAYPGVIGEQQMNFYGQQMRLSSFGSTTPNIFDELETSRTTIGSDIFAGECDFARTFTRSHSSCSHGTKSDGSLTDDEEKSAPFDKPPSPYFFKKPSNESIRTTDTDFFHGGAGFDSLAVAFETTLDFN